MCVRGSVRAPCTPLGQPIHPFPNFAKLVARYRLVSAGIGCPPIPPFPNFAKMVARYRLVSAGIGWYRLVSAGIGWQRLVSVGRDALSLQHEGHVRGTDRDKSERARGRERERERERVLCRLLRADQWPRCLGRDALAAMPRSLCVLVACLPACQLPCLLACQLAIACVLAS